MSLLRVAASSCKLFLGTTFSVGAVSVLAFSIASQSVATYCSCSGFSSRTVSNLSLKLSISSCALDALLRIASTTASLSSASASTFSFTLSTFSFTSSLRVGILPVMGLRPDIMLVPAPKAPPEIPPASISRPTCIR